MNQASIFECQLLPIYHQGDKSESQPLRLLPVLLENRLFLPVHVNSLALDFFSIG